MEDDSRQRPRRFGRESQTPTAQRGGLFLREPKEEPPHGPESGALCGGSAEKNNTSSGSTDGRTELKWMSEETNTPGRQRPLSRGPAGSGREPNAPLRVRSRRRERKLPLECSVVIHGSECKLPTSRQHSWTLLMSDFWTTRSIEREPSGERGRRIRPFSESYSGSRVPGSGPSC